MSTTVAVEPKARMPRQIPFIIANEGCERFSFYGMRNILTPFLTTMLLLYLPEAERAGAAKDVFHTFVIGVYFFPLLGGWLSDRFFGKYNTVLWFSLIYCAGHACLAMFDSNRNGFYAGLFLIALGSGGIKPLVASFVGDQFDQRTKHLAKLVFDAFYWIINFGSFFASLLMPIFLRQLGPAVAFGIPGILMFIATIVFWAGRRHYIIVPPAPPNPDSFTRVVRTALTRAKPGQGRPGWCSPSPVWRSPSPPCCSSRRWPRHRLCLGILASSVAPASAPGSSSSARAACTPTRPSTACARCCACWSPSPW
jgi:POT family proton-dependent oligopeptide transporter